MDDRPSSREEQQLIRKALRNSVKTIHKAPMELTPDLIEKLDRFIAAHEAMEDTGVYPAAWTRDGVTTERTPEQDGHNKCVNRINEKWYAIWEWLEAIPVGNKPVILKLILDRKIRIMARKPENKGSDDGDKLVAQPWVLCNDLFFWACADGEDIDVDEIPDLIQALKESPENGDILWVCRKRQMRPQKPYYKFFTDEEAKLFDACGPERDV